MLILGFEMSSKKEKAPEACSEARRAEEFFAPFAILV
jgi:hypothetical protein